MVFAPTIAIPPAPTAMREVVAIPGQATSQAVALATPVAPATANWPWSPAHDARSTLFIQGHLLANGF
jgi:hypothetical protein